MKNIIDTQFTKSSRVIKTIFFIYIFGFVFPFIFSLFDNDKTSVTWCLSVAFVVQLMLMFIELIQMRYAGFGDYLSDPWNYFDMTHCFLFTMIFIRRVSNPHASIIPSDEFHDKSMVLPIINNNLMILLITMKIMFFMRVYSSFATLVKLMADVVS